MLRSLLLLPLLVIAPFAPAAADDKGGAAPARKDAPPAGFHQVKLNGHTFTLPEGFTIEPAAGLPLADRPIVAAFDEKGRLYVCDSSGSNEPVAVQVKKKPHRIVRLEDTDGDGKFDRSTVFVPNVMFPEGAMWLNGSLYVAAPPQILKFTDTDGDGKADKEEVWFDGKTLTGCANDLHGPYLGPDGWVYWCKGAFAKQEYKLPNGKTFTTRASHIFRAKPDGSNVEPVMTGGMDNPVDVVFTPGGERIFSTTFFQHPGNGRRDGLIHAVYGGVYGKDHAPVYEHPWTSPHLMPVMTHLGPAAPCGLHRYESDQFGKDYENNIFCCQFNMRKVSRHVLVPSGSTFTTKDSDFVVSDSLDFHPTDVIEDADGSLLILDTGGWYKLCCPTSQLVKPDVTGAIYRVKKVGAHKVDDPRGLKIDWNGLTFFRLTGLLDDPRPSVREQASNVFVGRANQPQDPLSKELLLETLALDSNRPTRARLGAVWALGRMASPESARSLHGIVLSAKGEILDAVIQLTSLNRVKDSNTRTALEVCLFVDILPDSANNVAFSYSPRNRRNAAEALGRIGDPRSIGAILRALANETNDRVLDHALTYALIEIADPKGMTKGLAYKSPRVRRAVLAALDQMPDGKLDPKAVLAELDAKDEALRETAWWVAGRHPQWGDQLAGYFRDRLRGVEKMPPAEQDALAARLVAFAKNEAVQKVIAGAAEEPGSRGLAFRVMSQSGLKVLPKPWKTCLANAVGSKDEAVARDGFAVLRAVPPTAQDFIDVVAVGQIALTAAGRKRSDTERLALLAAAPPGTATLTESDLAFALRSLGRDDLAARGLAADVLVRVKLAPDQLTALAGVLRAASPLDVARLLPAFARSADEKVGRAFVAALSDPKLRAVVRTEQVKPVLDKYPKPVRDAAEKLYALFAEARQGERAKLEQLVKELPAGDIRRGQLVFNGAKAQCASCHKIGYVGGPVGPDLTRIGGIRTERDLLESIVFPSASFVRSYEPVRVTTLDGRTLQGILKKDAPDEIVLVVAADKEERVARADVETITPGTVSVMPAGLDTQLSRQDLADLVAFLKACK